MTKRFFTFSLLLGLAAFQLSCSQTNTANVNLANTNSANANTNVAVSNANTANVNASNANLTAEVIDAKDYRRTIKTQAEVVGENIKSGDFDKLVEYIHPKVFEMAGGRDVLIQQGREAFEEAKADGYQILSYKIGEPKSAVAVEKELFVVVPVVLEVKDPQGNYRNDTSLIAVSNDNGASWKFLSDMNPDRFKAIFPAAATKLVIPEEKIVPVARK